MVHGTGTVRLEKKGGGGNLRNYLVDDVILWFYPYVWTSLPLSHYNIHHFSCNLFRMGKPFNPLLGETYQLEQENFRIVCEQVPVPMLRILIYFLQVRIQSENLSGCGSVYGNRSMHFLNYGDQSRRDLLDIYSCMKYEDPLVESWFYIDHSMLLYMN